MSFNRKLACGCLVAALAASGCAYLVHKPVVAPPPAKVERRVSENRDWFAAASNIQKNSDFKPFEPILEEITGEKPVDAKAVQFISKTGKDKCEERAGGCYNWVSDGIAIRDERYSAGKRGNLETTGYCRLQHEEDLDGDSRLMVWLHEQGHHYDRHLGLSQLARWIDETEAEAFIFYAAEHIAKKYDARLGSSVIANRLLGAGFENPEWAAGKAKELIGGAKGLDPDSTLLKDLSVLVLLGSGLESFGDAWYYIHTHTEEQVAERVRNNVERIGEGILVAERILRGLSGSEIPVPASFDRAAFDSLEIEPFPSGGELITSKSGADLYAHTENFSAHLIYWIMENSEIWRLNVTDRHSPAMPILRVEAKKKKDGKVSLLLVNQPFSSPTEELELPDSTAGKGTLMVEDNPLNLSMCQKNRSEIVVDNKEYIELAKSLFVKVADALRAGGNAGQAEYVEKESGRIFGEKP